MARISEVLARSVSIPLATPLSLSTRRVLARDYLLVQVRDDDGAEGIGFCYAGNFGGPVVAQCLRDLIAPLAVGVDSNAIRHVWDSVYAATLLHGRMGSVLRALSALDIALWDLNARRSALPLWRYLGARVGDASVPAYASGGYYVDGETAQDVADQLAEEVARGFTAVKMRVGLLSPSEDAVRVRTVRQTLGPDVRIMLDANNAWRDLPSAVEAIRAVEPYDPFWIEEPFGPDDIVNHGRLSRSTRISVASGEIETTVGRAKQLITDGGITILQSDAAVCGGITEYARIAAVADAHNVAMAPHWFQDLHVHLVAAYGGMYVEHFSDQRVFNFGTLITETLEVIPGGRLALPERPGLAFDFDEGALKRYATEPWS